MEQGAGNLIIIYVKSDGSIVTERSHKVAELLYNGLSASLLKYFRTTATIPKFRYPGVVAKMRVTPNKSDHDSQNILSSYSYNSAAGMAGMETETMGKAGEAGGTATEDAPQAAAE